MPAIGRSVAEIGLADGGTDQGDLCTWGNDALAESDQTVNDRLHLIGAQNFRCC